MSDKTPLPSGDVTFMFTDIVGSTEMLENMQGMTTGDRQDAYRETVKTPHDSIIIERVHARNGHVVKEKGDGFIIAFADAQKAVLCGIEIQQGIGEAPIFTPSGILQIRIGLNTGQATPVAGDYTASAVGKAARVESWAAPGQVYLSRETHELIRDKVRGVSTASAGFFKLKGIANEELFVAFFQGSGGLTAMPPAIPVNPSPVTTTRNNLPRLQSFFGREAELRQIREALDPGARTWGALIDGPGGMGKTSLAVRAAHECPPGQFDRILFTSVKDRELDDDGVRYLDARLIPGFLEMLNELARELGLTDFGKSAESERAGILLETLRPLKVLLILDNLESLTKADRDELFTFIKRLPGGCKAILTSRRRIGSSADTLILGKLDQVAALATLSDIAERNSLLAKTSVAERIVIYTQTGGKPLLLRWVAGQLGQGSCRTFTDALTYLRSCPEGNDPLEFVFGDIAREFTDAETKVLCALSYFTQPATVEHIATVAGAERRALLGTNDPTPSGRAMLGAPAPNASSAVPVPAPTPPAVPFDEAAVEMALRTLANRSLVVPDQEERAYTLVPMVADFLRRKFPDLMAATGQSLEARAFALIVENGWQKHDRFPTLDAAWPTVAPALSLFVAGANPRLQAVCDALQQFFDFTGRWDEWLALSIQAEAKAVAAGDFNKAGWRARDAAWVHYLRQKANGVLACAERIATHWAKAKVGVREQAIVTRMRGIGHRLNENYPAALVAFREVVELRRSLGTETADVAGGLNNVAEVELLMGDLQAAERDYREALRLARATGHAEAVATCIGNLALVALARKDWLGAEALAREALPLAENVGRKELIASDHHRIAHALVRQGKRIEALPHAQTAVALLTQLGLPDLLKAQAILKECQE
jgi:class 3 adenylate cyclase/tetratricopeptide (TPR) repeat protein